MARGLDGAPPLDGGIEDGPGLGLSAREGLLGAKQELALEHATQRCSLLLQHGLVGRRAAANCNSTRLSNKQIIQISTERSSIIIASEPSSEILIFGR